MLCAAVALAVNPFQIPLCFVAIEAVVVGVEVVVVCWPLILHASFILLELTVLSFILSNRVTNKIPFHWMCVLLLLSRRS